MVKLKDPTNVTLVVIFVHVKLFGASVELLAINNGIHGFTQVKVKPEAPTGPILIVGTEGGANTVTVCTVVQEEVLSVTITE